MTGDLINHCREPSAEHIPGLVGDMLQEPVQQGLESGQGGAYPAVVTDVSGKGVENPPSPDSK